MGFVVNPVEYGEGSMTVPLPAQTRGGAPSVAVGIGIGQKVDPTAIAVCEVEWRECDGCREDHYLVRRLERLPLGTLYPAVAQRLGAIVTHVQMLAHMLSAPSWCATPPATRRGGGSCRG